MGEFDLIARYFTRPARRAVVGVGDDCALWQPQAGMQLAISTDMLVEGVHFDLSYVPLRHLGYKSVVVNLSDIFAMNAVPKQILVSIAISSKFSLEALEELYAGMLLACKKYKVDLVGGDTTSSRSGLVLSITALGSSKAENIVYRNTAKEGDLLCVSGDLGGAYMGLQILEREKAVFKDNPNLQPDLEGKDYILERQLKPEARQDVIQQLKELNIRPTAMIDISDGLSSEILHLCQQSEVGVELYEDKLPIDPLTFETAREFNLDPTVCVLSGGEDYELLFTIPISDYDKIKTSMDLTVIGHMTNASKGCLMVAKAGTVHELTAQGWNALLKK